jgi:hypothetical protein
MKLIAVVILLLPILAFSYGTWILVSQHYFMVGPKTGPHKRQRLNVSPSERPILFFFLLVVFGSLLALAVVLEFLLITRS